MIGEGEFGKSVPATSIRELQVMRLTEAQCDALEKAVQTALSVQDADFESDGGATLRWKIELAARMVARVCDEARQIAQSADLEPEEIEEWTEWAFDLTSGRAEEICKLVDLDQPS